MKSEGDIDFKGVGTVLHLDTPLVISSGGTGQTTAANAINALVPSQTGNGGSLLLTNGSVVSWATPGDGNNFGYLDVPQNPQSGTYSFVLTDDGLSVTFTGSTTSVWTVPLHSSVAFPNGAVITLVNPNSGANISVTPAGGVTIYEAGSSSPSSPATFSGTGYNIATLYQYSTDVWILNGTGLS